MGAAMKCDKCGQRMGRAKQGEHLYTGSGLSDVTLVNVEVRPCSSCDNVEVGIPKMDALHRVLVRELATKAAALTGAEIRAMRSYMGLGRPELALLLAVTPVKLTRWEETDKEMDRAPELALRYLVLAYTGSGVSEFMQRMKAPGPGLLPPAPARLRLVFDGGGWYADRRNVVAGSSESRR